MNLPHKKDSIPKDYFEKFESCLMAQIELEKLAPKIKNAGYKVPENYFEQLSQKVTEKATIKNHRESKVLKLKPKWLWAAASVLVMIIITQKSLNGQQFDFDKEIAALNNDEIEFYLNTSDLNTQELFTNLTDEELDEFDLFNDIEYDLEEDQLNLILEEDIENYQLNLETL